MIPREKYLKRLRALKDQNVIKVITGVRRCGKSTLLEAFSNELIENGVNPGHILWYNFEEREKLNLNDWTSLYDEISSRIDSLHNYYVFLDEIQLVKNFEKVVDSLFVRKNIDLYITGSNAYLLSGELATLLTGRYISINIQPYSFAEYCLAFPEINNTDRLLRQYLNQSSFPEAVTISKNAPELEYIYLQSIYDTVVKKDIVLRHKLRKFYNMQRVIEFLFDSVGSLVSPNNITEHLNRNSDKKISHNTVIRFINYLSEAYIIYPVPRYDIKGKELLTVNQKYYLVDLGLKNIALSNKHDSDLGHKLENVVFFELLRRGGRVFTGKNKEKEIDFIVQKAHNGREYYQVCYSVNDDKTLERELSSLRTIRDHYPKFLLTLDYSTEVIEGIQKINLIDWLLETDIRSGTK